MKDLQGVSIMKSSSSDPVTATDSYIQKSSTQVDKSHQDDQVSVFPGGPNSDGKTGVLNLTESNLGGHVIQTPVRDQTLADFQVGNGKPNDKMDAKVQVPSDTPIIGQAASGKAPAFANAYDTVNNGLEMTSEDPIVGQESSGSPAVFGQKNGEVGPSNQHGNAASQLLAAPAEGSKCGKI